MRRRKIVAMALLATCMTSIVPLKANAAGPELVSDDVFVLQYYQDQQKKEDEAKAKEEKKVQVEKQQVVVKSLSGTPYVLEAKQPTVKGHLRLATHDDSYDEMVRKINTKLANYPMHDTGKAMVDAGIKYNVDPYFITAIAIHESSAGRHMINTNNPFGRKSKSGWMAWGSFEEAIYDQAAYLDRMYLSRGLNTIERISVVYCPPTANDWANTKHATVDEIASL
ncbi:hypothetical protein UT300012_24140 [Paraclostridium bifermentans]